MRRREVPGKQRTLVARVHAIDERSVPRRGRIEAWPEAAIDEGIDRIAVADENVKVEAFDQQREHVLSANPFEAHRGTVPVDEGLFVAAELVMEAVRSRKLAPEPLDEVKRLRPALVSVSADDVVRDEERAGRESVAHGVEQSLEIRDVVERLIRDDAVVTAARTPLVEIAAQKMQLRRQARDARVAGRALDQRGIEFEAIDAKVFEAAGAQELRDLDLVVAVARADAEKNRPLSPRPERAFAQEFGEKGWCRPASETFEHRAYERVRPIVINRRKVVELRNRIEAPAFLSEAPRIRDLPRLCMHRDDLRLLRPRPPRTGNFASAR